jgi:hypothetical protein
VLINLHLENTETSEKRKLLFQDEGLMDIAGDKMGKLE